MDDNTKIDVHYDFKKKPDRPTRRIIFTLLETDLLSTTPYLGYSLVTLGG